MKYIKQFNDSTIDDIKEILYEFSLDCSVTVESYMRYDRLCYEVKIKPTHAKFISLDQDKISDLIRLVDFIKCETIHANYSKPPFGNNKFYINTDNGVVRDENLVKWDKWNSICDINIRMFMPKNS